MTRPKVWTRKRDEHLAAQRAVRAQAAAASAARRNAATRTAAVTVGVVALFVVAGIASNESHSPAVVMFSAGSGLVVSAAWVCHQWLRPRLGGVTAVLLISLLGAAVFLSIAAVSPTCPDSVDPGRCTRGELANWSTVGLLLPLVAALTVGTVLLMGRVLVFLTRLTYRLVTRRAPAAELLPNRLRALGGRIGSLKVPRRSAGTP